MSGGTIHFISKNMHNIYRYEDAALGFCLGTYSLENDYHTTSVVVVGRNDTLQLYYDLSFSTGLLPNFLEEARD
jgi:hypothetical protein